MKKIIVFALLVFLLKNVNAQLFSYSFSIKGLQGKLVFSFDSISTEKMRLKFTYTPASVNPSVDTINESLTHIFSEWEFTTRLTELSDSVPGWLRRGGYSDSALVRQALPIIIFQNSKDWYNKIQKIITAFPGSKPALTTKIDDPPVYSSRFYFNNNAYRLKIIKFGDEYNFGLCRLKESYTPPIPSDSCFSSTIAETISKEDFTNLFLKAIDSLDNVDVKINLDQLTQIANSHYSDWKLQNYNYKKKIEDANTLKENNEAVNAAIDGMETVLDRFSKLKKDKSSADFYARLDNISLYGRRITNPASRSSKSGNKIAKDKIAVRQEVLLDTTQAYQYFKLSDQDNVTIDSLSLTIENGYITAVILFPSGKSISKFGLNQVTVIRKYIDLRSAREAAENLDFYFPLESNYKYFNKHRFSDNRTNEPPKLNLFHTLFVNLSDLVKYFPRIDSVGDVLVQVRNRNLSFSKKTVQEVKLEEKSFSSFASINIFSDLVGLAEEKPNGIIQAEGKFDIGFFTQPIRNSRYYSKFRWNILHSAQLKVGLTKIENKLRYLQIPRDSVRLVRSDRSYDDTLNRNVKNVRTIDLIQYASFITSLRFNLLRFESDFTTLTIFAGAGIVRTPLNDTLSGLNNGITILQESKKVNNSLLTNYGITGRFKMTHNIGTEITLEWMRLRLNRSDIVQSFTSYDANKRKEELKQSVADKEFEPQIIIPGVQVYYYFDRDQQNRLYIRSQYYKDIRTRNDDQFTFQFGYSTDMKGLLDLFKKKSGS